MLDHDRKILNFHMCWYAKPLRHCRHDCQMRRYAKGALLPNLAVAGTGVICRQAVEVLGVPMVGIARSTHLSVGCLADASVHLNWMMRTVQQKDMVNLLGEHWRCRVLMPKPPDRGRLGRLGSDMIITFLIAKIILGGYWLMLAPVLFLPLGIVLLSSQVRRGLFGYVVLLLAVVFAALGAIFLFTLTLPDAVTVLAGVQAIWLLAAAITLLARNGKQPGSQSQELRTAKSSIT